jgi:hypothetical protein
VFAAGARVPLGVQVVGRTAAGAGAGGGEGAFERFEVAQLVDYHHLLAAVLRKDAEARTTAEQVREKVDSLHTLVADLHDNDEDEDDESDGEEEEEGSPRLKSSLVLSWSLVDLTSDRCWTSPRWSPHSPTT